MSHTTKDDQLWLGVPPTTGQVFWVAPSSTYTINGVSYSASDNNSGLLPEQALRHVNRAWALAIANDGDVIILLPGTHSAATQANAAQSVAANVAGVTMTGLTIGQGNPLKQRVSLTCVLDDEIMNITAADIHVSGINFVSSVTNTSHPLVDFSVLANNLNVHDCVFDVTASTANTGIIGLDSTGASSNVTIHDNTFLVSGAFGAMIDMTATLWSQVLNNRIMLSSGTLAAAVTVGAGTARLEIAQNVISAGAGTITAGIDGTGATITRGTLIHDNRFTSAVTVPVDNFDASEAELSENYDFGVGAGDGGVLVTAIT